MKYRCLSLSLLLLACAGVAHAEIYTWIDAQGIRHYSDNAASSHAKPAHLPGLQSVQGDPEALERLRAQQQASKVTTEAADSRLPKIVSPESEATIRDAQGVVPIAVTIGGAADLRAGEKITYYLDGSPIPKSPSDVTQLKLANVPRGSHTISASLLYQGRELRRTAPVTFYMKPPSAISPLNANQGGGNDQADTPGGAPVASPAGNTAGVPAAPRFNTTSSAAGRPPS